MQKDRAIKILRNKIEVSLANSKQHPTLTGRTQHAQFHKEYIVALEIVKTSHSPKVANLIRKTIKNKFGHKCLFQQYSLFNA